MAKLQGAAAEDAAAQDAQAAGEGQAAATTEGAEIKKLSPKHKQSRGVDPNFVTTWVPYDTTKEENERLNKVAKQRKVKIADLLQGCLKAALDSYKAQFDADAAAWDADPDHAKKAGKPSKPIAEMTAEELAAFQAKQTSAVDKAQKATERAKQMLEEAKARAAALQTG